MTEKVIELGNAEAIHKTSNLKQKGAYKKKKIVGMTLKTTIQRAQ